jgi:hypothetical protein
MPPVGDLGVRLAQGFGVHLRRLPLLYSCHRHAHQ